MAAESSDLNGILLRLELDSTANSSSLQKTINLKLVRNPKICTTVRRLPIFLNPNKQLGYYERFLKETFDMHIRSP